MRKSVLQSIEYWWRYYVVYPSLKRIFHNREVKTPIDLQKMTSILILRYDRIGDMIVSTPIFQAMKTANPRLKIGVFASETNAEIIRNNHHIDKIHVLHKQWWRLLKEIKNARNENYSIVLNFVFNRTTSGGILSNLIAPQGVKVGQGDETYKFYFNILLKLSRHSNHMLETLASIVKTVFDVPINVNNSHYDIPLDDKTRERVNKYQTEHHLRTRLQSGTNGSQYILFNLSANDAVRRISAEQALGVGEYLSKKTSFSILLLHAPKDLLMESITSELVEKTHCLPFPESGHASLLEIAAIIEGAAVVITPDTSIIHFATAAQTPLIGFYTSMQDVHEWLPFQVKHKIIVSEKNRPTSSIPIQQMTEVIDEFIQTLDER